MGKVLEKLRSVKESYDKLIEFIERHDKDRTFKFSNQELRDTFQTLFDRFRESVVNSVCGTEIYEAEKWRDILISTSKEVIKKFGLIDIIFSKELSSFLRDPKRHLMKKIFLYVHDLIRGRITFEEFAGTAYSAIITSLRTNMRTIYQDWVFLSILELLHEDNFRIIYPELGVISLERHSRQKLGYIPPNVVLRRGIIHISFFIEAPRPITWEDTHDLSRIWSLYTALRPDMLVYGDAIFNIIDLDRSPPIIRPHIIIECKELPDWYLRVRYIRGPLAKPLSAEEWRSKWLIGLRQGLSDILGVEVKKVDTMMEEKRSIRLKDEQIVQLYRAVYKPDKMIVVSRCETPESVKTRLEDQDIVVIDGVGFSKDKLRRLVETIVEISEKYSKRRHQEDLNILSIIEALLSRRIGRALSREIVYRAIMEFLIKNIDELVKEIERTRITS